MSFEDISKFRVFKVTRKDELVIRSTTDGYQPKYFAEQGKYFLKSQCELQRVLRDDWMVEIIASMLCNHYKIDAVQQNPCKILTLNTRGDIVKERFGVYSDNFEVDGTTFTSLQRVMDKYNDTLSKPEYIKLSAGSKFDYLIQLLNRYTDLTADECSEYISNMVMLDILVLNQDRHTHNFGLFIKDGKYSVAKLFDFGMGMFENDNMFDDCKTLEDGLRFSYLEPFGEEPVDLLFELFNTNRAFKNHLVKKTSRHGYLTISKSYFPNDLAKDYYSMIIGTIASLVGGGV